MNAVLKSVVVCAALAASSFLLARLHPLGNAGLYAAAGEERRTIESASIPAGVKPLLAAKCADCHSNQTHSPLYGHFAPLSWLMERDIVEGRARLNFSLWDNYSADQRQVLTAEIVQQTRIHRMPLLQYRLIHWNARITNADAAALANWAHGMGAAEPALASEFAGGGDFNRGKDAFERRCIGCHSMDWDREGPRLGGVYGRLSGTVPRFPYSPALVKAGITWDEGSLEKWLTDPDILVRGNNMDFHVAIPQERKDIVRYLRESGAR